MTQLMQKALDALRELPEDQQDWIATVILEEMRSDRKWDELFSRSPSLLERLGDEALAEFAAGRTEALDPDSL